MPDISVVVDTSVFEKRLTSIQREQLPFARSLAANQAAFETRATMQKAFPLYLDNPTPHTLRGVLYQKGTKASPAASIYLNNFAGGQAAYLRPLIRGGKRDQRRSERTMTRAGLMRSDEGWVPAAVRRNARGNVSPAMITRIMSGVRAFGEQGFKANITAASRKRGRRKGRSEYFISTGNDLPDLHLRPGIWERYGKGRRKIRPVLLFVDLPNYSKQLPFFEIASKELRRRFLDAFPAALRRAMRTARPAGAGRGAA